MRVEGSLWLRFLGIPLAIVIYAGAAYADAFVAAAAIETRVHKGLRQYKLLRQLARTHRQVVGDVVRVQGRLKAIYRSWSVPKAGTAIYGTRRDEWTSQLDPAVRPAFELLYDEYDRLGDVRHRAHKELVAESNRHGITRRLETAPGMGPIRVAEAVAVIVTPHRFRTARQLWSYSGMGLVMPSSDYKRDGDPWVWAKVTRPRTEPQPQPDAQVDLQGSRDDGHRAASHQSARTRSDSTTTGCWRPARSRTWPG